MSNMVVTLDVSQLSGWLNAAAPCRVARGGSGERGRHAGSGVGGRAWGEWRWRKQLAGREPAAEGCWPGGTRGAHVKYALHGCDTGCVKAQRLVEMPRALPGGKGEAWERGRHAWPKRWEGVVAAAQAACREGASCGGSLASGGTRGAHPEHVLHDRDAGRVEAQRLVERPRVLPSGKGEAWGQRGRHAGPGRREGVG